MDWVSRIRAIVVQIGLQGGWRGGLQTRGHLRFTITHFQVVPSPLDARLAQRGDKSIGLVKKMQIQLSNTEIQLNNTKIQL